MEKHGVAVDEGRSPCPRIVAAVMLLDLDHLGAHVAKDHAGHRPRHRLPDLDHLDARERPGHAFLQSSSGASVLTLAQECKSHRHARAQYADAEMGPGRYLITSQKIPATAT